MKELATQKVSLGEKIGYSMGDAAANLVFQMMMIFQLKFYTDVFGLDGAVAGSILMIGSSIVPRPAGESSVLGCFGRRYLSVSSICLLFIIPA